MRAVARLIVMGLVLAVVLGASVFAGLGTTTAVALGIVFAGIAGLVGVARRPRKLSGVQEIEAMLAADPLRDGKAPKAPVEKPTAVESMAPVANVVEDP